MRVALLQIRLEPKSPAANVQGLSEAIERAARADPAPDLLVLPGACDTGGATSGRRWHDASLECAKENLAWKAREWGVFIAAGLHVRRGDTLQACALLFDPDGDVVARSVAPNGTGETEPIKPWPSAVGELAVLEATIAGSVNDRVAVKERRVMIAMPTSAILTGKRRRLADANLVCLRNDPHVGCGAYFAVVVEAEKPDEPEDEHRPTTCLYGPKGTILVSADSAGEMVLYAEVPLEPATREQ
jgi:hypothetical protein